MKRRLWIVDSSPADAALTQHALGGDHESVIFGDGSQVVERLAGGHVQPDALLLAWMMPGTSGDEVMRRLRSHEVTKDLPIILVTPPGTQVSDIVTGLELGANDYVARPFAPEELRARVESAIRTRRAAEAAARERRRLATLNQLGRTLLDAGSDVAQIIAVLAQAAVDVLCDGCSVRLLPGELPEVLVSRHRGQGEALSATCSVAFPVVHAFDDAAAAKAKLAPAYHAYIDRFGLRGLAILPFPILSPVQGIVTLTRDGSSAPFEPDDLSMIETCIEYTALAVQKALRFETERIARTQLDAVLESLPIGVIATNEANAITLSNASARAMIPGLEQARTTSDVYALADWRTADGQPLADAEWAPKREIVMRRADQTTTFDAISVRLERSGGASAGTVTVLQDVTRDRAIAQEREQAAKFAQRLVGIVGHDLRSPLGAFVAGLGLLEMRSDSVALQPITKRLQSSARRMTRIVDQLLDVTRATFGTGIQIQRRETELLALVRGVVDEIKAQQPDAKISIVHEGQLHGRWDPERLEQVISNLLTNALYYGRPNGPVQIELARAGESVSIAVHNELRDKPIPADVLAVLFDPHRRGGEARHNAAGLGLGLYIVQQIVSVHRGVIVARSDQSGTEFRVTLPA